MTNVVYGHFDSALSLHAQLTALTASLNGAARQNRLSRLYAGAIGECLLDCEDWKAALDDYFGLSRPVNDAMEDIQWNADGGVSALFLADKDSELGRSIVRGYLDDTLGTSMAVARNIRVLLQTVDDTDKASFGRLYSTTCAVLGTESCVHRACDLIIENCIGGHGWTLGDCVQAMGCLSGMYYARSLHHISQPKDLASAREQGFECMVKAIMNEAVRLGMPDHAGIHTMLPANDIIAHIPFARTDFLSEMMELLFSGFGIADPGLKSVLMAKATGRMMAVAAAGDEADMDCCVVTPLALTSMQGSYRHGMGITIQA